MKAVIPVAGLGTRMLPMTKAIPKEIAYRMGYINAEQLKKSGYGKYLLRLLEQTVF